MKTIIPILILTMVCLTGCATWGNVTTTITDPNSQIWVIESRSDALVHIKSGEVEIIVDNRGRASTLESILGLLLLQTNINLSNKEGDNN